MGLQETLPPFVYFFKSLLNRKWLSREVNAYWIKNALHFNQSPIKIPVNFTRLINF